MSTAAQEKTVDTFRQILFWPLRLMPVPSGAQIHEHWKLLEASFRREFKSYAASHDLKLNELLRLSFEAYRREMGD